MPGSLSTASYPRLTRLDDSGRRVAIAGWIIIAMFFGVFGTWMTVAPLNGAVVANGVVKVEGNRKSVQHLDGGIVKELRVKEGDHVTAGETLIVLDDTQARAEYGILAQHSAVLRATEARLMAELGHKSHLDMPDDLKGYADEPYIQGIWEAQVQQFESRRAALEGQRSVIRERISQLQHQIVGIEGQVTAYHAQLESIKKEKQNIRPLVEKGLISQPRYLQLERSASGLEGQMAESLANISRARQAIAEQTQQMAQLDNDRMTEVTKDLRDTQADLLDVIPKITNARAVLSRMEIRSPYSGQLVALSVFSVGAVINRGDKILDIVPDEDSLVVEAQVSVDDISEVHPHMRAEVHLTAYKQRIVPMIHGDVIQVSADRLSDNRTGNPYYVALIRVDQKELADLPNIRLYPGMPASVMIPTKERTALDYLIGPLVMSFNHAFRQK